MDFDSLIENKSGLGTAGIVVINKDQDIVSCMARIARFYKHESCGQCTPCREGSGWMWRILNRATKGETTLSDIDLLEDVTKQIEGHTICAFGEGSAWPVQGLLRHFRKEVDKKCSNDPLIKKKKDVPYLIDQHLLEKRMPKIIVNGKEIEFQSGMTVLQACELAGAEIPRFCYHERLSIAGNCRMCLVEMDKSRKPIASCAMPAAEGMNIKTNTEMVEKARKGVMEFLLANHPLDCPVCDQGGECDLQDQSLYYGVDKSRFSENKRYVSEKYMGPLIKTQMTRCIHCTRCVRFATEVAGVPEIGAIGRGENMEITTYLEKSMESELSGNVIDLCPVGALTSKPYAFSARPWELKKTESIDVLDAVGSNIRVDTYGWEVKRILPRLNEDINEEWISDKTRYSCDGLLKQRLDTPYVKKNNKLVKSSWDEALNLIFKKFNETENSEIAGHIGDLVSLETTLAFKKFFELLGSNNLEFREKKFYINSEDKMNYLFNSSINGIEKSDLILLVGCNPRHEATILNARIRKAFRNNKTPIFSVGNPGDQTYEYKIIGDNTQTIKDIIEEKHEFNRVFDTAKKPLIIIGESALELNSGGFIFEELKNFLYQKN